MLYLLRNASQQMTYFAFRMTARRGGRRAAVLDGDVGGRRSTGMDAGGCEFLLACGRRIQYAPRLRPLDPGGRGAMLGGEEQRQGREAEEGRRRVGREEGQRSCGEREKEGRCSAGIWVPCWRRVILSALLVHCSWPKRQKWVSVWVGSVGDRKIALLTICIEYHLARSPMDTATLMWMFWCMAWRNFMLTVIGGCPCSCELGNNMSVLLL